MADKYKDKPVHFVFGNPKTWMTGVAEKIYPRLKPRGFADAQANFSALEFAEHPDLPWSDFTKKHNDRKKADGTSLTAATVLIDPRGKIAFFEAFKPEEIDEKIAALLKVAPVPVNIGSAPYDRHAAAAKSVQAGKEFGATAKKLEALLDPEDDPEARRLLDVLKRQRDARMQSVRLTLWRDPALAEARLKDAIRRFEGSALGKAIKALDPAEARAAQEFRKLREELFKVEACETCKKLGCAFVSVTCDTCRKDRAKELAASRKAIEALLAGIAEFPIAKDLRDFLARLP